MILNSGLHLVRQNDDIVGFLNLEGKGFESVN